MGPGEDLPGLARERARSSDARSEGLRQLPPSEPGLDILRCTEPRDRALCQYGCPTQSPTAAFCPRFGSNYQIVSTTCASTLAPNESCQVDVVYHPVMPYIGANCRLAFFEDYHQKVEAELSGRSSI